jgi:hypothetical protein
MTASVALTAPRQRSDADSIVKAIFFFAVFFIPMKAFALPLAGQSIYVPYIGLAIGSVFLLTDLARILVRNFSIPLGALLGLSLLYYWETGYQADVFVFPAKILVMFAMSSLFIFLLRRDEDAVMRYLFAGIAISVVYMVYQAVSVYFFGAGLPYTSIEIFQIGRGLGSRYGLVRTTGFTEEPSYMAVMLVGTALMLRSYQMRRGLSQGRRFAVIAIGLLLCTSNSLFATLPLLLLFGLFAFLRVPFLFFVLFYAVNLSIAPAVLNVDETFFARFSSYIQFLRLDPSQWWFGIGFNQYSKLEFPRFVSPEGTATLVVDSIASLWGGVLLEGGIFFATLFCLYLSRLTRVAKDSTGFALMAILIMLANYYSPWWPIVSLALAYTVVSQDSHNKPQTPNDSL